jgi:iron(III) transport system ATP-binding protein
VEEALDIVNLSGLQDRSATKLSGGQQQRVALARAIVHKPRLLLLDEPLSNLDAALREEMRKELKRLQKQLDITTVYVTHDQTEALEMSDQIAVIDRGDIVQMGTPREIYFHPCNAFIADFVGTTNWFKGVVEGESRNGVITVRLPGGSNIECASIECALLGEVKASIPVRVSVRPESLTLNQGISPVPPGVNRLTGSILFAGFLGNMNRYQIAVNDSVVQAYTGPLSDHKIGETICIDFPSESAIALSEN